MCLTLILGPMKSGKSFDLISHFAPLRYSDIPWALFQSARHTRDTGVCSRNGASLAARPIASLAAVLERPYQVVGIDEVHMFPASEVPAVAELLERGTEVVAAGLDMDYRGELFEVVRRLLELGPKEVRYKRAVCEVCRKPCATHTQVYKDGAPLVSGYPSVLPEDGTYGYKAVCRSCFVKESPEPPGRATAR